MPTSPEAVSELVDDQTVTGRFFGLVESMPDREFVNCGEGWLTYRQAANQVDQVAAGLQKLGVTFGDRVAFVLPSELRTVLTILACARLGAITVPINTFLRGDFLLHQLADSGASVILSDPPGLEHLRPIVGDLAELRDVVLVGGQVDLSFPALLSSFDELKIAADELIVPFVRPADTFTIMYTSGTTGIPKGCVISNQYAVHIPQALSSIGRFARGDRILTPSPLFHASGQLISLGAALVNAGSVAFEPQFHASTFIRRAAELDATVLFGVSAIGMLMLAQPPRQDDTKHSIRHAFMNAMTPEVQMAMEERFGFAVIGEVFGHTEFIPATGSKIEGARNRASAGVPMDYVELALVDDEDNQVALGEIGEIVLRPKRPGVMFDGYWRNPEATVELRRNLWHRTGDCARYDADGFLHFADRKKDAIRRRGEFVASRELEIAIRKHSHISDVAVHAVPSAETGDEIKAWLVLEGESTLTPGELFEFFKRELPYFAIPRYVEIVGSLPVNGSGRIMKHQLKEKPNTDKTWDFDALGMVISRSERRGSR